MHDDPPRVNLNQVQLASPDNEPDDALVVRRRQFSQARRGSLQDRQPCVFQRPRHRIGHRPRIAGFGVKKPESRPSFGTQAPGKEERCDCGNSGLKKSASGWEGHDISLRFCAKEVEAAPTASIVTAFAAASEPPCCRAAGWRASSGEATPRPILMKQRHLYYWRRHAG